MDKYFKFFNTPDKQKWKLISLVFISGLIILIAVYRSFNRVCNWKFTHWVFNYQDEFVKRGLPGEMLRLAGLEVTYDLVSLISTVLVVILLCVMIYIYSLPLRNRPHHLGLWFFFWVAIAHPATFQSYHWDIGRYDGFNLLLALSSILIISKAPRMFSYYVVPVLLFVALLIHEGSFFMYIPFVIAYWIYKDSDIKHLSYKFFIFLMLITSTYYVSTNGLVDTLSFDEHVNSLKELHGDLIAASSVMVLHKGSISENIALTADHGLQRHRYIFHIGMFIVFMPLAYLSWQIIKFDLFADSHKNKLRLLFIFSAFSPLLLYPLAHDHFRWWALALTNFFLALSILAAEDEKYLLNIADTINKHKGLAVLILLSGLVVGPLRVVLGFDVVIPVENFLLGLLNL